jgi:hypothetical protein
MLRPHHSLAKEHVLCASSSTPVGRVGQVRVTWSCLKPYPQSLPLLPHTTHCCCPFPVPALPPGLQSHVEAAFPPVTGAGTRPPHRSTGHGCQQYQPTQAASQGPHPQAHLNECTWAGGAKTFRSIYQQLWSHTTEGQKTATPRRCVNNCLTVPDAFNCCPLVPQDNAKATQGR